MNILFDRWRPTTLVPYHRAQVFPAFSCERVDSLSRFLILVAAFDPSVHIMSKGFDGWGGIRVVRMRIDVKQQLEYLGRQDYQHIKPRPYVV